MNISKELTAKYEHLIAHLKEYRRMMIAFSGGVDSTFLLKAAHEALGENVVAVTAVSCFIPEREQKEAKAFCQAEGIRQIILPYDVLHVEGVKENPHDRCYICKLALLGKVRELAQSMGITAVAEGSNLDDMSDYRPGAKAVKEMEILSPLQEHSFSKAEIRALSHQLGLETWQKPSYACLASRFVYGETITEDKLKMIDRAEQFLINRGFRQMRVRIHGDMARIELLPEDMDRFFQKEMRESVLKELTDAGFSRVTVDLAGFQSGSMNKGLTIR